jgi:putative endonuclease
MDKQWIVYILQCSDGILYTGITHNLSRRLTAHNSGKGAKYTRCRRPVSTVYTELCTDKSHALRREFQIKQLSRSEKLALCSDYVMEE